MPYSDINFNVELPHYDGFYKFKYNNHFTFEQHTASLGKIFDRPPISTSKVEKVIRKYLPDYSSDKLDRSKTSVAARAALSKQVQAKMLENHLKTAQYIASAQTKTPKPGAKLKYPYVTFLRVSDDPKDLEFNQELEKISEDPDPRKKGDFLIQELERSRQALGIKTPEDTAKLMKLPDETLLEKFDQIRRYFTLSDTAYRLESIFTAEQKKEIRRLDQQAIYTNQHYMSRMNFIANPYYAEFGTDVFRNQNVGPLASALSSQLNANPSLSKALSYFDMINKANTFRAENLLEEFYAKEPSLKDAALSCYGKNPTAEAASFFQDNIPVTALTTEGQMKVLVPNDPVEIITAKAYMESLSAVAARTNRGMITGSRAFSNMEKALSEMMKFNQNHTVPEDADDQKRYWDEYKKHNDALIQAAKDYLKHKQIEEPYRVMKLAGKGKNQREQRRLDVAFSVLNMAQGNQHAIAFGIGEEFDLENVELPPAEKRTFDPEEWVLENLKAPKGFVLDEAEDLKYYPHHGTAQDAEVKKTIMDDREKYDIAHAEDIKENQLELEVVLQFDAAKLRLSKYSSGDILPDSKEFPASEVAYKDCVTSDLNRLTFRYALEMEDLALKGEDGVLWNMVKTQGYEKGLAEFSKLAANKNAYGLVGLKGTEPKDVKDFLDQNGWKQAAKNLMTVTSELVSTQSQKRLDLKTINEVGENHKKSDLDPSPNTSKHSKPMTAQF